MQSAFLKKQFHPILMHLLSRIFAGLLLLTSSLGLSGCATTPKPESENNVSTIPWNRPASWEGRGPLGGMMMMEGR